jgi:hypothetical protein
MDTWGVVFLGIIALMALVQGAFLVGIAVFVLRVARGLDALEARLDKEFGPALANLERISRNAAEVSDLATVQARRFDLVLGDTIDKVEDTVTQVQRVIARPLRPVANILAVIRGVQKGIEVFSQLEGRERASTAGRRQSEDDEHLFI